MKKKLLYYCSYVPVEILQRAGFEMQSIHELSFRTEGRLFLPGSPCSFIQYCRDIPYRAYDGILFANCCNSSQRMYDYVKYHYPDIFCYLMELPGIKGEIWNYEELIRAVSAHFACSISLDEQRNIPFRESTESLREKKCLLVLSSAVHEGYVEALKDLFEGYCCHFITCNRENRGIRFLMGEETACPRRPDYFSVIRKQFTDVRGVIVISQKNCDPILFSYPDIHKLCQDRKTKCLLVEEEYGSRISSRSRLRYEAFLEELEMKERKYDK